MGEDENKVDAGAEGTQDVPATDAPAEEAKPEGEATPATE